MQSRNEKTFVKKLSLGSCLTNPALVPAVLKERMNDVSLSPAFLLPPASETHVWALRKSSLSCRPHLSTLFPQLSPLTKALRSKSNGPSLLSVAPEPHPKAKGSAGYIPRRTMSVIPIYNILIIKMVAGLQYGLAGRTVAGSPGVHLEHKPGTVARVIIPEFRR